MELKIGKHSDYHYESNNGNKPKHVLFGAETKKSAITMAKHASNQSTEEIRVSLDAAQDEYDAGMSRLREKIEMGNDQAELPKILLPVFDGSYSMWTNFSDIFEQTIHKSPKYGDVQKLQLLKTYAKGEANRIIRYLQTSANNYQTAWSIMKLRYNNERRLIHTYYRMMMDLPKLEIESRPTQFP